MQCVQLTGLRQAVTTELPRPVIAAPHEVLLQVSAVGICGSDVHYYTTGRIGSQVVEYPFIVGHEFSGRVIAKGELVTRVSLGDLVAVDPAMPCYSCEQCRKNREHTCRDLRFLGCPGQAEGCLSEFIVMPEKSCFRVPHQITPEEAALVEPLSIGLYAVRLAGNIKGCAISILGCGPIGLSVMLCAKQAAAGGIFVSEPLEYRRKAALENGAEYAVAPDFPGFAATASTCEKHGFDFVFECCGQQSALDQAVEMLKPGGTLLLIGIPETDRIYFNIDLLRRKEIKIVNVRRQNGCVQDAIDLVAQKQIDPGFMITHRGGLHQAPHFFEMVAGYSDGIIKAMCIAE